MPEERPRRATVSIAADNYRTRCTAGDAHEVTCDEPVALGGQNLGPTPVELFLMAIGACKAMTARMYADRKGWPLTGATCNITQDMRQPDEASPRKVPHIDIAMRFDGDLDAEQRARLLEIAEKCPVQKMITGDCVLHARLADEEPPR
jgi:putative redox protein